MKISTQSRADLWVHIAIVLGLVAFLFLAFFFVYLPFTTNHGESVTVPELNGMSVKQLEDYLDERNLRYEISDCTFVAGAKPLTVVRQHPKPGMKVKAGRKIYIYITSLTAPDVKMPELEDRTIAGRSPNTLDSIGSQTVGLGGSFRLSPNMNVTAGVRYSQERERLDPLTNAVQDSQAVYVGTQIKF